MENREIYVAKSRQNLSGAITNGDKREINEILRLLKSENGAVDFRLVLAGGKRLPQMFKENPRETAAICTAGLTMAFESMNLSRPMSAAQLLDLVDAILDSAKEDQLGLEDLMLFLQGLTRGEYGALYESMDIPKFMEKFEIYRQSRHEAYEEVKYEQQVNYKSMGDIERASDNHDREKELNRSALGDYLKQKWSENL